MNSNHFAWDLCLLGRAELLDQDGAAVQLQTKKILVFLAYLCKHSGAELSRTQLAEVLWPDSDSKAARDSLRNALAQLRNKLPLGAIEASADFVKLQEGYVRCDAYEALTPESYSGEFMPGFTQDWIVEHRITIRTQICDQLIRAARQKWDEGAKQESVSLATRACEVDPYHQEAAQLRVHLLELDGRQSQAISVSDAFRVKALRELGLVSDVRTSSPAEHVHPLATAAEWLLDRNPEAALEMLASTHSEWLTIPVELALDIHRRALKATSKDSPARQLINAQTLYLYVLAGRLGNRVGRAETGFREAVQSGEGLVGARLAGALAYGYLSRGDFKRSLYYAKRSLECAELTRKPIIEAEFEQLLGIIHGQVGNQERAWAIHKKATSKVEKFGTPQMIAGHGLLLMDQLVAGGKLDQASQNHENSKRVLEACGANRMMVWVQFGEVMLNVSVGDNQRAKETLLDIKSKGAAFGGHSITAMSDDWIAHVDCQMGELESAAEAFARSATYRKSLGTVPSIAERAHLGPTKRILTERLDSRTIRSAFRKAERQVAAGLF